VTGYQVPTPGQTIGPFFGYALPYPGADELVPAGHPGAVRLHGEVVDGGGQPVPDALLELWQLDPDGSVVQRAGALHRDGWTFTGWGRAATDSAGRFSFTTLRPGPSPSGARFFAITVFARGLLNRLFTRAYLPGEDDALLSGLPADRRATLVTKHDGAGTYRFDVVLQGFHETVFLTYPGQPGR